MATRRAALRWGVGATLTAAYASSRAATATSAQPIVFGQSVPLTGGSVTLGAQLRDGTQACFDAINAAGGVNGRRLVLETLDDAYQPAKTLENTQRLAQRCFAFTGYYGTPTVEAVTPFLEEQGIPMVGFVSGATSLRSAERRMLFSVRASYDAEIAKMIEHNRTIGIEKFAAIYQDDSLKAMQAARRSFQYMVRSPIGADALSRELGRAAAGIGVAQVFPHPMSGRTRIVREYLKDLQTHAKEAPGYYTLEGYINARVVVHALRQLSGEPSRAAFHRTLEESGEFDLGGFRVRYAPRDHQGSRFVELTVIGSAGGVLR